MLVMIKRGSSLHSVFTHTLSPNLPVAGFISGTSRLSLNTRSLRYNWAGSTFSWKSELKFDLEWCRNR